MDKEFKGVVTYKEDGKVQKLSVSNESIFRLTEMFAGFDDLDIIEIHIFKEN